MLQQPTPTPCQPRNENTGMANTILNKHHTKLLTFSPSRELPLHDNMVRLHCGIHAIDSIIKPREAAARLGLRGGLAVSVVLKKGVQNKARKTKG